MKVKYLLLCGLLIFSGVAFGANRYSVATGNWNATSTWSDSPTGSPGFSVPVNGDVVCIQGGFTVTVNANTAATISSITIASGSQLTIAANFVVTATTVTVNGTLRDQSSNANVITTLSVNGTYQHACDKAIPTATFAATSNCEVTGLSSLAANVKVPAQTYGNLTWNCVNQTRAYKFANTMNVQGDFIMQSTGTGSLSTANDKANVVGGDFVQDGGSFIIANNNAHSLTVSGNFEVNSGTFTNSGDNNPGGVLNVAGDFTLGGTLAGGNLLNVYFNGTTTQNYTNNSGAVSGTLNYTVNSGATLYLGDNVVNGTSFTVSSGATLGIGSADGITTAGNSTGNVQTTTRTFNTGANYVYNGTEAQDTGNALPTSVNDLTIDNNYGVTLSNNLTVNGTLTIVTGDVSSGSYAMNVYDVVSENYYYFEIPTNTTQIAGFNVSTSTNELYPAKINRQWVIYGTWSSGDITCRFYWDSTDDNDYDWVANSVIPSVYKGTTEYAATAYSLNTSRRWVEVAIPAADDLTKGDFEVGPADDETLPIELSSFTVTMNAYNMVTLMWVTQSETNVSGFRIYRNTEEYVDTAQLLNIFVPATNTSQMQVYQITDEEVYQDGVYYYWLENIDLDGASQFHGPISINVILTNNSTPSIPVLQGISQAYPNPFNPKVTLICGMLKSGSAKVEIYNVRGQLVKTLFNGVKDKGNFTLQWDGTDEFGRKQPSGVYLIKMDTASGKSVRKVVLSK